MGMHESLVQILLWLRCPRPEFWQAKTCALVWDPGLCLQITHGAGNCPAA